jgi:serine/threonine protein kinase
MLEEFKHHPNIIKKHEYHDYKGHAYIAFKFPKANSLFDFLSILHAVIEPIEFDDLARFLFRQFIAGLKEIHDSDKAHLDIKTQNVFAELLQEPNQEEFD